MDIKEEREAFEKYCFEVFLMSPSDGHFDRELQDPEFYESVDTHRLWKLWQAKSQAVPEGFVLVEKSKVRTWYQDDDEPENFCNSESDLDCLGECLDHEDILRVNKIEDAIIQTTPMYGVWKFKIVGGQPEHDCFVLCNTEEEAISIREEYRRMIDFEAQEQKG